MRTGTRDASRNQERYFGNGAARRGELLWVEERSLAVRMEYPNWLVPKGVFENGGS